MGEPPLHALWKRGRKGDFQRQKNAQPYGHMREA
jgi:hypothetical protein